MLELRNVYAGYSDRIVVKDVSITVPKGNVTVLLGPNGCGKSTLLKALCGIVPMTSGELYLDGENLRLLEPKKAAQRLTYLAQSRQVPDITVSRLVLHGRFPYLNYPRRYRKEDYAIADAAMEQMGLTELADRPMEQLSGGQRQKVYIAMALAQDTPVILLDEPTTYLDIKHQLQIMHYARKLATEGKTVLMVVHDLDQAMKVADKIVLMKEGTVVAQGTPDEVFASGTPEEVFGINMKRVQTENGWHYYFEERSVSVVPVDKR